MNIVWSCCIWIVISGIFLVVNRWLNIWKNTIRLYFYLSNTDFQMFHVLPNNNNDRLLTQIILEAVDTITKPHGTICTRQLHHMPLQQLYTLRMIHSDSNDKFKQR